MSEEVIKEDTQPVRTVEEPYYQYPGKQPPPPPRRGGCGCWIIGILTLVIVAGLIIAGLFLPPFNLGDRLFGEQYAMLSPQSNAATANDLTLIVDPADTGTDFGVALGAVNMDSFLNGSSTDAEWVPAASAAVPPYLALQSRVYSIDTTGSAPGTTTLTIALPPNAASPDVLDVYGWNEGDSEWHFIPARVASNGQIRAQVEEIPQHLAVFQSTPLDPIVLTKLDIAQTLSPDAASLATIIAPAGMQPALPAGSQNTLIGNPAPGFDTSAGYLVMPFIRNFADPRATDPDTVTSIIGNRELRDMHVSELTTFAGAGNYDGVFLDYRDLDPNQRENFSAFVRVLAESLHSANLRLGVAVPAAQNIEGRWETGAYNWRDIGEYADYVQINFELDPTTFTPGADRLVEAMLRWAVGEVNRQKLLGGLSALSLRQVAGNFTTIGFDEALSALGDVQLDVETTEGNTVNPGSELRISLDGFDALPGVDTTIQSPFIDYMAEDGSVASRMWLTTGAALRFRMDRMSPFGIGGVAFNDLLARGVTPDVMEAIVDYKIQLPANATQSELVLNWRIENTDGQVTEFTTNFIEEVVVTLAAPDGNYAVNVDVVSGGVSSARTGAEVALFAPTATPTPLPTATPTPIPTATPTLAPIVPTVAPPSGGGAVNPPASGGAPVNPGAGSIGAFEYGGHVTSTGSERAVNAMRIAGMTWMKVQIPWGVGGGTDGAASAINQARANGFKVLLGLVGNPGELQAGGADYIQQFANFAGDVAALGPDAIEIWNEPNLSREWPEGQISGANYTALLGAAYNAVKSRNSGVLVISAALAPTGAEGAYPGQVVNDDNFIRQMVDAGALNVMDCLGMHYNEGTVRASATSGDFRDNYYTRYLPTMINTYWNLTGGQKPICITELGYLSPEGYSPLPAFWSWAQNVTVAQQAAWLAEAAAFSAQSGRVQMMIIWNIDFTRYDAGDPMGGYAIIRPDGSCPACSAMAAAR